MKNKLFVLLLFLSGNGLTLAQAFVSLQVQPSYITTNDTITLTDSFIIPQGYHIVLADNFAQSGNYFERRICYEKRNGSASPYYTSFGNKKLYGLPPGLYYVKYVANPTSAFYNNNCDTITVWDIDSIEITFTVHSPAAIPELSEASVTLLPNPAAEQVAITLDRSTTADIAICDMSGAVVRQAHLSNQHTINIDIADLPKGMYIATIRSAAADIRKRLVKW